MNGMSHTFTVFANSTNGQTFPNVTVPNFEALAGQHRESSGLESIVFAPFVSDINRTQWESYALENQGWVEESRRYVLANAKSDPWIRGKDFIAGSVTPFVFEATVDNDGRIQVGPAVAIEDVSCRVSWI